MIKFKFISAKKPDTDGEFGLLFEILEQDVEQVCSLSVFSFTASNGWTVKSTKKPEINAKEKIVYVRGKMGGGDGMILWLVDSNIDVNWFKTEAEMLIVMKEVSEALEEWSKAGGFPQVADTDVRMFSY